MRMLGTLVTVFAIVAPCAGAWAAPIDPEPDRIGIYFDQEGISTIATPAPYTPLTGYILATNISRPAGISGWECTFLMNPASLPAGITVDFGADAGDNVFPLPRIMNGFVSAATGNPIRLATISTYYLGGPILFGLGPLEVDPAFGGLTPGYEDGDDPAILVPLTISSDQPWTLPAWGFPVTVPPHSFVCACVGDACAVPAEASSWGSVKALYR